MSVQEILDSGKLPDNATLETLSELDSMLSFQIKGMKEAHWGAAGQAKITQHERLQAKVLVLLNRHHGIDGMTPLTA